MAKFSRAWKAWTVGGLVAGAVAAGGASCALGAAAGTAPVDEAFFTREVQPLLQKRCLGCHGLGARLGRLDLHTRETALRGGSKGAAVMPGSAERSLLFQMVSGKRTPSMPPQEKLPAAEVETLRRWIDGGAPWAGGEIKSAQAQVWWSFKVPQRPPLPKVKNAAWVQNPIDAFVLAKLEANGLKPNPPASRGALIRRAYQDMWGLPPTPEEVRAFETSRDPKAWEQVVDRLLASPHYGERWGRHWLDLVRFAESAGFEGDKDRPNVWRYRDYVIDAFNKDKPYNQFVQEQIAGDEIRPGDRDATIATGYLGLGVEDFAMVKLPMTRADELDDLVSTTGASVLGLTLGCARCHDHKYDPVTQQDYYRIQAIFAPTERREVDVPTPEERREIEARNAALEQELTPLRNEFAALKARGMDAATAAGLQKPSEIQAHGALSEPDRKRWEELQKAIQAGEGRRLSFPRAMVVTDKGREFPPTHLLIRGDANHPGPEVEPGFIKSLPGGDAVVGPQSATVATTGRRKALAEWLTSPNNPLTARVWMNRVWRQHFGRGIVNSPSNFGLNGELPTHPELLDWLATRFAGVSGPESKVPSRAAADAGPGTQDPGLGWRLKPIHRLILLSATYQQSSAPQAAALKADPQNRWLSRMPVRRLEGEAVRDSVLFVAGTLNPEMGGPPVYPPVDPSLRADTYQGINWPETEDSFKTRRRSVYVKVKRSLLFPQLEVFDCPEITSAVAARNVTTTPNQALTMLNDPLILKQAELFAQRVAKEAGLDSKRQVERAYWLALCRPPTARETALSLAFLQGQPATAGGSRLAEFCHAVLNLSEFVYVP